MIRAKPRHGAVPEILTLIVTGTAGCYHPEPLDTWGVLNELRQNDAVQSGPGAAAKGATSTPPSPPTALTEDFSVALALHWNRELRAFRASRGIVEGEVITAGTLANPELRMELTHIQERTFDKLGWDLRLTWEPPRPGVRAGRRGAARAHLKEVDQQISEREWDLACDVRGWYATLLALDEEIKVAQDTVANRQRLAEAIARRVAQGGTTRFDLDLVRLSLAAAEHAENERRVARNLAASTLIRLLGVGPPGGTITVIGQLTDDAVELPPSSQSALEDRALAHRALVGAARAHYDASEESLRAETAARWPWFRLAAAPRVRRNEFFGATTDLVLGLDVTLPILDTNVGRVRSATAARDVARAEVTATLAGLRADIARALATVDAQRAILRRLRTEIAPLLTEHDRVLAMAAKAAELDLPSLIASENLVLASRLELIRARLELRKAWITLERSVGARLVTPPESN